MANVLNRTTRQYLQSVNTPEYPVGQWIIDPDLSAVVGFGSQYWIIAGDVVTLMDAAARAAVDAAALEAARDSAMVAIDQLEAVLRAQTLAVLDEVNVLRAAVVHPLNAGAITRSGTTATVTTPVAHGLATNDQVLIAGADVAIYNGLKTITVTDGTHFTYTGVSGNPASPAVGSIWYQMGLPPATAPRTVPQVRATIRAKFGS